MSRFRRTAHGLASGYAVLAVVAFYGLASIPLALHYLSKERFGLWALMTTIGGYLSLVDLGMSHSVARLLIDHKDRHQTGEYGTMVSTGWLVLVVQGALVASAGFLIARPLCSVLEITNQLKTEFITLVRWQSLSLGAGFAVGIFSHILRAHQRVDIVNYLQIGFLVLNLALIWLFFSLGIGVLSLAWASMITTLLGGVAGLIWSATLGLLPSSRRWGTVSPSKFKAIFSYGMDLFLVSLGTQLIMASQTMIVTRQLGLKAAATWAVATRPFFLLCQMVWRVPDTSAPALSEMLVRGEKDGLKKRYNSMFIITASLAGVSAILFAVTNSLFIEVWTDHKILWPPSNDVWLGLWLIVLSIVHMHSNFVLMTKEIRAMRYVYFAEGIVFAIVGFLVVPLGGVPALIATSIVCSILFSGAYGVRRVAAYFDLCAREVAFRWLIPMGLVSVFMLPIAALAVWAVGHILDPLGRLAATIAICAPLAAIIFLRAGLPKVVQIELLHRLSPRWSKLLRSVFAA